MSESGHCIEFSSVSSVVLSTMSVRACDHEGYIRGVRALRLTSLYMAAVFEQLTSSFANVHNKSLKLLSILTAQI